MISTKFFLESVLILMFICAVNANWGSPDSSQYHIQTDEGDERFFRYQTDNGQFRKEKRLKDGTVIGTEAWIDASGYLRFKEYIANENGYNVIKSKTIFVGIDRPIQEAMQIAKGRPATAGTYVNQNGLLPKRTYLAQHISTTTTTSTPPPLIHDQTPLYLAPYPDKKVPAVYIRPHSEPFDAHTYIPPTIVPSTTPSPLYITPESTYLPSSTPSSVFSRPIVVPSQDYLPPAYDNGPLQPIAVYEPSSTPATPTSDYGLPIAIYNNEPSPHSLIRNRYNIASSTPSPIYPAPTLAGTTIEQINNELEPPRFYPSSTVAPDYAPISSTTARPSIDGGQPIFNRGTYYNNRPYAYQPQVDNGLGDGYTPQFPYYDGVSATKNGFGYFLRRQYHEENNRDPERRDGSFGYIDPFGIRRVVYYNTSPERGFDIRKNNRYVGHNATPYDPRPN